MKELKKYPVLVIFCILLFGISFADLFSPVKTYSETENRSLASFPELKWKSVLSGKYMTDIEDFTEDHFIGRDTWISLKSVSEMVLGKQENNGVVYGKDSYLFTKMQNTDYSQLKTNVKAINSFADRHPELKITFLLAPTAPGVMTDKVAKESPVIDTDKVFNIVNENLTDGLLLNIVDAMKSHSDEYIYYMTDHHWTTHGAFYAYAEYMNYVGKTPVDESTLTYNDVEGFLGTHYSKSKNFNVKTDVLSYITTDAQITIGENTDSIYDYDKLTVRDKYAAFLRGNNGLSVVYGEGEGRILVIKDSYANSFVPFMTENYEQIHIIDLRYLTMGLDAYIEENEISEVLFLYNAETILTDNNLSKANLFN